jgi:hypothetical protein
MGYPKSEMLKKFQHDRDIAKGSIFDYALGSIKMDLTTPKFYVKWNHVFQIY